MNSNSYGLITNLKVADICLQAVCFLFMICTFIIYNQASGYSVCIMALEQCLSTLYWMFFLRHKAKIQGGIVIRNIFLVVMSFLIICLLCRAPFLFGILIAMIVIGPILGFTYFFVTVAEISFYQKLRKP